MNSEFVVGMQVMPGLIWSLIHVRTVMPPECLLADGALGRIFI